jgi:hypothetical protein
MLNQWMKRLSFLQLHGLAAADEFASARFFDFHNVAADFAFVDFTDTWHGVLLFEFIGYAAARSIRVGSAFGAGMRSLQPKARRRKRGGPATLFLPRALSG